MTRDKVIELLEAAAHRRFVVYKMSLPPEAQAAAHTFAVVAATEPFTGDFPLSIRETLSEVLRITSDLQPNTTTTVRDVLHAGQAMGLLAAVGELNPELLKAFDEWALGMSLRDLAEEEISSM